MGSLPGAAACRAASSGQRQAAHGLAEGHVPAAGRKGNGSGLDIDIIIPIYKPGEALFTLLDRLEGQSLPPRKIILMNTEEAYFTELLDKLGSGEFNRRYPNVQVHHVEKRRFDHGGTRREAVGHSEGEVFLAMTQDAMPVDRFLVERLTERLTGNVAAAYARQLPGPDCSEFERASRRFNYPEASRVKTAADLGTMGIKTFFCSNVCAAYRRDIYEELGGFIGHTIFNEDMIYAAAAVRAGYGIAYEAGARVIHSHNYTNIQQLRRNFDLGVSQAEHPEVFGQASSESEGKRLVKETWRYLKERKRLRRFPGFCVQCAFKYAGYLLGKHYRKLPRRWVMRITMNPEYWERETE